MTYMSPEFGDLSEYKNYLLHYNKYLKDKGVFLLKNETKAWYELKYLLIHFNEVVSASDIQHYVSQYTNNLKGADVNIRELWKNGYNITSGKKSNYMLPDGRKLGVSDYILLSMKKTSFVNVKDNHRCMDISSSDWNKLLEKHNHCCATCGIHEGTFNKLTKTIIHLQKGHIDPNKPLTIDNCIPQCQDCNQTNKNNLIFTEFGGVKALNTTYVFDKSSFEIQKECVKNFFEMYPDEKNKIINGEL